MKAWGVYDDELHELAEEVGLRIRGSGPKREGRAYRFRLALHDRLPSGTFRFQKVDHGGYGTSHVCWHGQREFLYALFRRFPEAVVDTAFDRYHGAASFHRNYKLTRGMSIPGVINNEGRCTCPIRRGRRSISPRTPLFQRRVSIDLQSPQVETLSAALHEANRRVLEATSSLDSLNIQWHPIVADNSTTET